LQISPLKSWGTGKRETGKQAPPNVLKNNTELVTWKTEGLTTTRILGNRRGFRGHKIVESHRGNRQIETGDCAREEKLKNVVAGGFCCRIGVLGGGVNPCATARRTAEKGRELGKLKKGCKGGPDRITCLATISAKVESPHRMWHSKDFFDDYSKCWVPSNLQKRSWI